MKVRARLHDQDSERPAATAAQDRAHGVPLKPSVLPRPSQVNQWSLGARPPSKSIR